ncbi:MAG TPA: rhodanese-like domain-containing protein [Candidatus Polarisedimenticolaceae bacterium]|nr:rhodanese-like domain-containing protein [Candidatus Polarisedimenticolaceae bacterium]
MSQERFEPISGDELYRRLATGESLVVLDVRTENEYAEGHIPGSLLIPLQDLEARVTDVPNSGTPIAVVCEHGVRSVSACRFLAESGFEALFNLSGGLVHWPGPVARGLENGLHRHGIRPSSWLVENFDLLPKGLALDVAMGEGRNAIYLATRGFDVDGVDSNAQAVARARAAARKLGAPIRAIVGNVEDGTHIIPIESYQVILVFNYLHRPLFKDVQDGVVPGGVVVYQTYTQEQARFGRPRDPRHLLRPGELREVFREWEILRYREVVGHPRLGEPPRAVAGIVVRKPAAG